MRSLCRASSIAAAAAFLASCEAAQSALHPAGRDAERIADLFTLMAIGALVVWAAVMGCALYAVLRPKREHAPQAARRFIVGGGVVLPTLVLTALLVVGLAMLPDLLSLGPSRTPIARVSAEQFWWRVRYPLPDGGTVELANELHLPVGRRVALALESPDVVHSFWVPALAGKVDAIPGRVTMLGLEPTRAGAFRGVCAEYCGRSHARMRFDVVTTSEDDFQAWLAHQASPARPPTSALARRGEQAFLASGCGACHAVRGTEARGAVGPDLTHVGGRRRIAGVLANDVAGFRRWLGDPDATKPGVHMPAFDMVPQGELLAIATYLDGLE